MPIKQEWFVDRGGNKPDGPCGAPTLEGDIRRGKLTKSTLVWRAGQDGWLPAGNTELLELFDTAIIPPPLPDSDDPVRTFDPGSVATQQPSPVEAPTSVETAKADENDLLAAYNARKRTASASRTKDAPESNKALNVIATIIGSVALVGLLLKLMTGTVHGPAEAIEACQYQMASTGGDVDSYDWDRGFLLTPTNYSNAPFPTKIDGMDIKCVLVPKVGVKQSFDGCGFAFEGPEDHYLCLMVHNTEQGKWMSTWEAALPANRR